MAIVAVPLAGQYGISLDTAPAELPANAWSSGTNARFSSGEVLSMPGDALIKVTPTQATWALPVLGVTAEVAGWVLGMDDTVSMLKGTVLTDITPPGPYTPTPGTSFPWSGGNLGLVTIVNNEYYAPWCWMAPDVLTPMIDMPNWQSGVTCYTLRSFKQVLVALDVTKTGGHFPTMVKWSHPADPGSVPPSWDETDPTKDAGEVVLAETPGRCTDLVSLRDVAIIYKTDSVWGMQFVGGTFIYRFYKIFGDWGIPIRNCAVEYLAGKHFCFTGTDLVIHDGTAVMSVISGKMKRLLQAITAEQLPTCFVCTNPLWDEVWFCFRRAADGVLAADTAIIYNHKEGTLGLRALPNVRYIGTGRVTPEALEIDVWDTTTAAWDALSVVWAEYLNSPAVLRLVGLGELNVLWVDGAGTMLAPFRLERTYVGIPTRTDKAPDLSAMKFVRRVWPRITGETGTQLVITFGSADSVSEPIQWKTPLVYTLGVSRKLDITLSGKVMAIRIEAGTPEYPDTVFNWKYQGLDIDVVSAGEM